MTGMISTERHPWFSQTLQQPCRLPGISAQFRADWMKWTNRRQTISSFRHIWTLRWPSCRFFCAVLLMVCLWLGNTGCPQRGTLPSSHLTVSPPCEMQALPDWASDSTGVFVTTLLCHWFRCGTLLQAGGSPPLTHMSQSPSSQAWWHVKLLNNFRAAGPQFARDGTFRPSHCHACTEQATFYCLVCSAQTVFQINLQPCWRPLRKMADDQADTATAEPPPKRLKTARDYAREARRPDKRSRQLAKAAGKGGAGSWTTRPRTPATSRPITVYSTPPASSWPPPEPPSRPCRSLNAVERGVPEPRTPTEETEDVLVEDDHVLPAEENTVPAPSTPPVVPDQEVEVVSDVPGELDGSAAPDVGHPQPDGRTLLTPSEPPQVRVKAMPKPRLWKPRRVSQVLAAPVEPPAEDVPPRQIRGSVGRMLQQRRQASSKPFKPSNFVGRSAWQLIQRTTAAKTRSKPPAPAQAEDQAHEGRATSTPSIPGAADHAAPERPPQLSQTVAEEGAEEKPPAATSASQAAPELVHPSGGRRASVFYHHRKAEGGTTSSRRPDHPLVPADRRWRRPPDAHAAVGEAGLEQAAAGACPSIASY